LLQYSGLEATAIYAIIETAGKQYKVTPGQLVRVDHLPAVAGSSVEIDRVLLIADGEKLTVGNPVIAGAKVTAQAQSEGKGEKVYAFRYKAKSRHAVKVGHRQLYTEILINEILPFGAAEAPKKHRTTRKKAEAVVEEPKTAEVKEDGA
jgi:large subunit ribosomal protein L21